MQKLSLLILIFLHMSAFASRGSIQERILVFTEQLNIHTDICFTSDGTFKQNYILIAKDMPINEATYDCSGQHQALLEEEAAINDIMKSQPGGQCEGLPINGDTLQFIQQGSDVLDEGESCKKNDDDDTSFIEKIGCSFGQALVPIYDFECGLSGTECIMSILAGVGYSFKDFGCSIYSLFGGECDSDTEDGLDEESASSDAALMAALQSSESVDQYNEEGWGAWIQRKTNEFVDYIANNLLDRFGCHEWSGTPYLSKCDVEGSWDCANHRTKLNMFCGAAGYIAGVVGTEFAAAFFTGGIGGILARGSISLMNKAKKFIPKTSLKVAGVTAGILTRSGAALTSAWNGIQNTVAFRALTSVGSAVVQGASWAKRKSRFVSATSYAFKKHNELVEKALSLGFRSTAEARLASFNFIKRDLVLAKDIRNGKYGDKKGNRFRTPEDYMNYQLSELPPSERKNWSLIETPDGYLTLAKKTKANYNSGIVADLSNPASRSTQIGLAKPASFLDEPIKSRSKPSIIVLDAFDTDSLALSKRSYQRAQNEIRGAFGTNFDGLDDLRKLDNINDIPFGDRRRDIVAGLSDNARIAIFEDVTGLALNESQASRLIEAHKKGKGFGLYTRGELTAKGKAIYSVLREKDIPEGEIREMAQVLLDKGILGKTAPVRQVSDSEAISNVSRISNSNGLIRRDNRDLLEAQRLNPGRGGKLKDISEEEAQRFAQLNRQVASRYEADFLSSDGDPRLIGGAIDAYVNSGNTAGARSLIDTAVRRSWTGNSSPFTREGFINGLNRKISNLDGQSGLTRIDRAQRDNMAQLVRELGGTPPSRTSSTSGSGLQLTSFSSRSSRSSASSTSQRSQASTNVSRPVATPSAARSTSSSSPQSSPQATPTSSLNSTSYRNIGQARREGDFAAVARMSREEAERKIDTLLRNTRRGETPDFSSIRELGDVFEASIRANTDDLVKVFNRILEKKKATSFLQYIFTHHGASLQRFRLSTSEATEAGRRTIHQFFDAVNEHRGSLGSRQVKTLDEFRKDIPRP